MSAAAATVSPANPGAAAVAPAVSAPSTIQQASSVAQAAVQLDHDGAAADAATLYDRAASLLRAALSNAAEAAVLSSQQQAALAAAQQSYAARADALRALAGAEAAKEVVTRGATDVAVGNIAAAPPTTSATVATTATTTTLDTRGNPQQPSVLQVGADALATVNREGGKYLVAGYQKAQEVNAKYDVTGKVAAGVTATVAAVKKADEDYKITERAKNAATSAYQGAVNLNREHHITEKIGTVAKATATKVAEVNREYKITERAGNGLLAGLNYLATASQSYLQGRQGNTDQQQNEQQLLEGSQPHNTETEAGRQ